MLKVLLLLALLVVCASAAPARYFSSEDNAAYLALVKGSLGADGLYGGSIRTSLAAAEALVLLNEPIKDTAKLCEAGKNGLNGDLASISAALKLRTLLKCPAVKTPESAMLQIEEALGKVNDPVAQLYALTAAGVMQAKGLDKSKVSDAIDDIVGHCTVDGFKLHDDADAGSAYYLGAALEAFSSLTLVMSKEQKASMSDDVTPAVKKFLTSGGESDDKTLYYHHLDSHVNEIRSTSTLLDGIVKFSAVFKNKIAIGDTNINKLANFFLTSSQGISKIDDAFLILLGLNSLNAGVWRKPLVVTATQTTLRSLAKGDDSFVRLSVADVFGNPALTTPKVFLVSLSSLDSSAPLITNQELTASATNANVYDFNLLATKPAPGTYKLTLSVTPSKADATKWTTIKSTVRFVKVISSIELSELQVVVSSSNQVSDSLSKSTIAAEAPKSKTPVKITDTAQHLLFSFSLKNKATNKPISVQQAFFLVSQGEKEIFFVAKFDGARKTYSADIPASQLVSQFNGGQSGTFAVKLLIGDSFIDNSVHWDVIDISLKVSEEDAAQLAPSTPVTTNTAFTPKPEIHHKFRVADKRADVAISRVFTLLTIAPFGLFILGLLFVGLNFGNCPDGIGMIWALAFHGCILAVAYILWLFFYQNNLFQTLKLLAYAALPTIFIGHRALRAIAIKRAANLKLQQHHQ